MTDLSSAPTRSCRSRAVALAASTASAALVLVGLTTPAADAAPTAPAGPAVPAVAGAPDLGPNVHLLDPSMSQGDIQATVDAVAAVQIGNQFGSRRDAILFMPGTYGSVEAPLNFQVGYYTEVAGLGQNPGDVVINGAIDVFNQCDDGGNCFALNNFWRSMSNLTINVANPADGVYGGCHAGEFWAVSQAAPMRRVQVNGATTLMDYCSNPAYASGGFIADSRFDTAVVNGSQQQFIVRNSAIAGWSNGVWNQVFAGVDGAPAQCFPQTTDCGPYTTLATTPVSKEKPYLYVDGNGVFQVFVPAVAADSSGTTWTATTQTPGQSIPLSRFYVAKSRDSAAKLNQQLGRGYNLLLTPGTYRLESTVDLTRAGTVVLGLGLATLTPTTGKAAMTVGDVAGVDIAGVVFDAGRVNSPVLLQVGSPVVTAAVAAARAAKPTALQDVFFRIGGPQLGRATTSLEVNSSNVILDDIWAWRADHGAGVGWTQNTATTGVIVNGDDVTATGLFVEHYQGFEVVWNGERGNVTFFQNELPYDVPHQGAWSSAPGVLGYAALKIAPDVQQFTGSGMGSYSFFNQGVDIYASNAFEVPRTPGVTLHDLLTVFLDPTTGKGGILNVVNNVGGPSTVANPSTPVTVVDFP